MIDGGMYAIHYREVAKTKTDNEGIVKVLSKYLAEKSINILEMETHISHAPVSGTPLFNLNASVSIPNDVEEKGIQSDLSQIAQKLGVEIQLNN